MNTAITHAYIAFKNGTSTAKRFQIVECSDIRLMRSSTTHIEPKTDRDFVPKHVYYVKYRDCAYECDEDHEHVGYYSAFILLLGENEDDIRKKIDAGRRLVVPVIKDSSESEGPVRAKQKMKTNKFAQEAQAKKNRQILLQHDRTSLLSSREPLRVCDSDDDEVERMVPIKREFGESENTMQQLQDKDDEIQRLKKRLLELQDQQNLSDEPMVETAGDMGAEIRSVRRNLFPDDPDEPEEYPEIGRKSSNARLITSPRNLSSPQLAVKRIQKVRLDINGIIKRTGASTSSANPNETVQSEAVDPEIQSENGFQESDVSEADPFPLSSGDKMDQNVSRSRGSDSEDSQLCIGKRRPETAANSDDENTRAGDNGDENSRGTIRRIQPTLKRKKSDNTGQIINKKIFREIEAALRYYASNDEIDAWGKKMYEVTGTKVYLGEGISLSATIWFLIKLKKPTIFVNDLMLLLWGERTLVNRCQNIAKVTTNISDRSPMKELTPKKKPLLFKLYSDYLDGLRMKPSDKMEHLADVPRIFSSKISNLRNKLYK